MSTSKHHQDPARLLRTHDIIVVGASAGGVEALTAFVAALPEDFPGAIFIVLHLPATGRNYLDSILSRAGPLPAGIVQDGEPLAGGRIYLAQPDHHLLLASDCVRVACGPRENRSRPAIDPLFRTAAMAFGPRVVGVVLSGVLNDGTAGLMAIKERGGVALAQDPQTALFPQMPSSAARYVALDGVMSPPDLARRVAELAHEAAPAVEGASPVSDELEFEAKAAGLDPSVFERDDRPGALTALSCPECQGPIWETHNGDLVRFRCRVGHAFTAETMVESQMENVESSLWFAINALEESAELYSHLADSASTRQQEKADAYNERARRLRARLATLRKMIRAGEERGA